MSFLTLDVAVNLLRSQRSGVNHIPRASELIPQAPESNVSGSESTENIEFESTLWEAGISVNIRFYRSIQFSFSSFVFGIRK